MVNPCILIRIIVLHWEVKFLTVTKSKFAANRLSWHHKYDIRGHVSRRLILSVSRKEKSAFSRNPHSPNLNRSILPKINLLRSAIGFWAIVLTSETLYLQFSELCSANRWPSFPSAEVGRYKNRALASFGSFPDTRDNFSPFIYFIFPNPFYNLMTVRASPENTAIIKEVVIKQKRTLFHVV